MARFAWLIWGALFSVVLFLSIYFLIYVKVTAADSPDVLRIGNIDVSKLGVFFSEIKNVILTSLIIGFLLGLIINIGSRREG